MKNIQLEKFFNPKSIAVIGARNRSKTVGMTVFKNLLQGGYKGQLYAINPKHKIVQGQPCYAAVTNILSPIDLVVIATPANTIPEILIECGNKGIENAIILSAGFSETGIKGAELESTILNIAKQYNIRIMGPNCLGIIIPDLNINASFSNIGVEPGQLALVSQSGALCVAILDWALPQKIGFSSIVSLGNVTDIDFGDVLEYLALDPKTQSILLYIEGIRDARKFMDGLRLAAKTKPVVVIKTGRFQQGSAAANTHTGALIGEDDVFDSALKRAGAVRVMTIEQLFTAAKILSKNYLIKGDNLCIITNGGGAGVMAADFSGELNIPLASPNKNTISELDNILPKFWSHHNPIDILGDATPERYKKVISLCLKDPNVDGLLIMLVPVVMSEPTRVAKIVIEIAKKTDNKPILTCWLGQGKVKFARNLFMKNNIPFFNTPEEAIEAFSYLLNYYRNQKLLLESPPDLWNHPKADKAKARSIIHFALAENRNILTIIESKAILSAFGININQSIAARSLNEALEAASSLGYPVAMKVLSPDITHKKDVGGVELNIINAEAVKSVFKKIIDSAKANKPNAKILGVTLERMYKQPSDRELMVGIFKDKVFGPVISFGLGGSFVEILRDRAVALPPVNQLIAKQLIAQTHASKLLGIFRNMPSVNIEKIEHVLIRVSEMVSELPEIQEMDINPLIANENEVIALDVRIIVNYPKSTELPYGHMAIDPSH
jgi:acetyltransferase